MDKKEQSGKMRRKDREVTDRREIDEIIDRCDSCRIGFAVDNEPYIVSLNFGYKSGDPAFLYFHCATAGKKLDMLRLNNHVFFQMDCNHNLVTSENACGNSMTYESAAGKGMLYIVDDKLEKITGLDYIMKHYTGKDSFSYDVNILEHTVILRLEITGISAKRKS